MVAALSVYLDTVGSNGAPGTSTDIDALTPVQLEFKNADNATIDGLNGIGIPGAGTNYSRWKQIYVKCDTAPAVQVDNIRFHTDGANNYGTGLGLKIGNQFPTKNSGSSAGYEVADTANEEMVAGHGGITSSVVAFTKTNSSPLVITISETGNKIDAIGETSNYIVLQAEVGTTAGAGLSATETLTILYDEI